MVSRSAVLQLAQQNRSRVLCGGSFYFAAPNVRSAIRTNNRPVARVINYGFRVARTYP